VNYPKNKFYELSLSVLLVALIAVESGGNPKAVGKAGERGLCQIMQPTWEWICKDILKKPYSWREAFDEEKNQEIGMAYLLWIRGWLAKHRQEWRASELDLILATYNCGPGRVRKAGFDMAKCPKSTREYVRRVKGQLKEMKK
jgi:soluble lytic murein transglycosylase-like protein